MAPDRAKRTRAGLIQLFEQAYNSSGCGAEAEPVPYYHEDFLPLTKELDNIGFFFDLFDMGSARLRAWGFLGIFHLLRDRTAEDPDVRRLMPLARLHKAVIQLLQDERKVSEAAGCFIVEEPLRIHHVDRLCILDASFTLDPIWEYCTSPGTKADEVVGTLLEEAVSLAPKPGVEGVIMDHARKVRLPDFKTKNALANAIGNLSKRAGVQGRAEVSSMFKRWLKDVENDKTEQETVKGETEYVAQQRRSTIAIQKKRLQTTIISVAAALGLGFEPETIHWLKTTKGWGSHALGEIATAYRHSELFTGALIDILSDVTDPSFAAALLDTLAESRMPGWYDDLLKGYIRKNRVVGVQFLRRLAISDLVDEEIATNCLQFGGSDQYRFIVDFFAERPETMEKWHRFRKEFLELLALTRESGAFKHGRFYDAKKAVLTIARILKSEAVSAFCLKNVSDLSHGILRALAVKAILAIGKKEHCDEAHGFLESDEGLRKCFEKVSKEKGFSSAFH
ncbi:MAG: hypothetical protein JW839_07105 [Candidatus Lokiarchaeota archaeon]|nr:hypothetical protein [Candidatus Lokiarchaeota archaeon]